MKKYSVVVIVAQLLMSAHVSPMVAAATAGIIQRDPCVIRYCLCACMHVCCNTSVRKALVGAKNVTRPDVVRTARTFDLNHASGATQEHFMALRTALRIETQHPCLAATCAGIFSCCSAPLKPALQKRRSVYVRDVTQIRSAGTPSFAPRNSTEGKTEAGSRPNSRQSTRPLDLSPLQTVRGMLEIPVPGAVIHSLSVSASTSSERLGRTPVALPGTLPMVVGA